jgi:hypothetical protein
MKHEAANDASAHPFAHGTSEEDFQRLRAEGNMFSSGPVDPKTFERGWAHAAGHWNRAHYFRRLQIIDVPAPGAIYKPICTDNPNMQFWHTARWPLFGTTNWTRCSHCIRIATKRGLK